MRDRIGNSELQSNITPSTVSSDKKATIGFALSLVASLIILVQGILRATRGEILESLGISRFRIFDLLGLRWEITGAIGIVFGVLMLFGAILIYSPGKDTIDGIVVLVFAARSIVAGGGWLLGLAFGIAGGILELLKK